MGEAAASFDNDGHTFHQPVMVQEVVQHLAVKPDGIYLDATLGEGGHASAILDASSPVGRVVGIDLDPRSLERGTQRLEGYGQRFIAIQGNYADMATLTRDRGIDQVDGVLMDLGFSSRQVEEPKYGLSFRSDEPLDMRYDPGASLTAAQIVNTYSERELAQVIFRNGEEHRSRAIARDIVRSRPIGSAVQLAEVVARTLGRRRGQRVHPATRTFQALRICVNDELGRLESGLTAAVQLLASAGRLVIISYHSLEDRLVKNLLIREAAGCICPPGVAICSCEHEPTIRLVSRRVVRPTAEEVRRNPRSRSAKMRVAESLRAD